MRTFFVCAFCLLALPLFAAQSAVTYVGGGKIQLYVEPKQFTKPVDATGLVAPIALVARIPFRGGLLAIALDADTPEGTQFTRVRLDFSGAGHFTPACAWEVKKGEVNYPLNHQHDFPLTIGNRKYPVSLSGSLRLAGANNQPTLSGWLGTHAETTCAFGNKTYTVEIDDDNQNWRFGDLYPLDLRLRDIGDTILVYQPGQRAFCGYYGHLIEVEGQLYQLTMSPDESTITVTPFTGPTGQLALPKNVGGILVGKKYMSFTQEDGLPHPMPADDYHLVRYELRREKLLFTMFDFTGKGKLISVQPNTRTTIDLGATLVARVQVKQTGRNLIFSLDEKTATGFPFSQPWNKVVFLLADKQGHKVYENTFESG